MKLEKALSIISRIDSITEDTSEDEIFDIIDDAYLLIATECKTQLDVMKSHIDEIVAGYEDDTNVEIEEPRVARNNSSKQTSPTEETVSKKSTAAKQTPKRSSTKKLQNTMTENYDTLFD